MTLLLPLPDALKFRRQHTIFDDFEYYIDGDQWTATLTDTGTAAVGDGAGGVMTLTASDGTEADNDEAYLESTQETFDFAANKPLIFEARTSFTEANTDDANILVGLKDAVAANSLLDNGGGPAASYSGAVFFKVDGETVWRCESSVAGAQVTTLTTVTAGGGYQTFRIEYRTTTSTVGEIVFFIDGTQVAKHAITFASATEMQIAFGVKNGDTNVEVLLIDYVCCTQLR